MGLLAHSQTTTAKAADALHSNRDPLDELGGDAWTWVPEGGISSRD